MSDSMTLASFSGPARLFPLPNLVMFPQVVQGLHIFEPRYRQLMEDVLEDDQLMALVLLKPGWEDDYEGQPPIESVACLSKVSWHEKLPDGSFNLRVRGLSRINILEETPTTHLYRTARVELITDTIDAKAEEVKELRKRLAAEVMQQFENNSPAQQQLQELFDGELQLGQVCDVLSFALPLSLELKQLLLAEDQVDRRAAGLIDAVRASAARANRIFPPEFSSN
jgi:Lon protease-like protein